MMLHSLVVSVSVLTFTPSLIIGNFANAQTITTRCSADSDSCQHQINRLVEQSYQNYRTPQRITQKRLNSVTNTCNDRSSSCDGNVQKRAESEQNSEILRQIRNTERSNLENTLQR
jgi:hypothetical protein